MANISNRTSFRTSTSASTVNSDLKRSFFKISQCHAASLKIFKVLPSSACDPTGHMGPRA
eukprot:677886-Hanusia_phi.AAC.2